MGTPARTSILLDIQSTLTAITVANGYKTTVAYVDPYLRPARDVPDGERPYLGFGMDLERYTAQAYDNSRIQVPWTVVGYTQAQTTWALMSAGVNNLIDDVIVAVMADGTLGGNAVQTQLVSSETSEADPHWSEGGWCFVDFLTTYYRDMTAS